MFRYNTASACGGPCHCNTLDPDCYCDNCIGFSTQPQTFWERIGDFLLPIVVYIGIVVVISFIIALCFYLVYRHEKDEHPWKHAIKRSWPWWIIVFLLPFVVLGILSFGFI